MGAFRRVRANDEDNDQLEGEGVEDMINLLSLTEESLLKNIRIRYEKQLIYTYTGSILVAVNPYRMFNIYGLDVVKQYEDSILGSQPPHLFAIGSASFQKMNKDFENQAIIISGESGAGKTESTKLLMQYLAAVNRSGTSIVTERILETNPLLESFGNAKTIRNDNSSRFGKYVELYFKGGSIVGAKTSEYLLEKSRIVTQAADERNYHVFYELLSGLSEDTKRVYGLTTADRYYYLNQGGSCTINTKNDGSDFRDLQAAMEVLSFTKQEQDTIYKILAAVLHLGNIYFVHDPNEFQQEGVTISPEGSDVETRWVCLLLQLDEDWLREALTKKITEARQERLVTPLNTEQAQDARDAVAKALYQRLFTWLVERINVIVKGPEPDETTNQRDKIVSIAILDIFGFEDFRTNSFEQLCINYANESLQFYFNKHIFKQEQQEYTRERINWTMINFHDNQPTIDLIAKKPSGIIHILDDESNFPKGTDQSFLEKCHYTHQRNPLYEKPRMSTPEFGIKHYAGKVTYNVKNFLDKNRDTLRADVVQLLIQSKNSLISKMFQELRDSVVTKTISKMSGLYVTMKPKTPTVAAGFHESLLTLIDNMTKCNPWFVRCIKPNNQKMAMMFEQDVVLTQLRYTGMLETIRIRKLGFPIRHRFYTFAAKYFVLLPHAERKSAGKDDRLIAEKVLRNLADEWDGAWQIGQTKVFLREALGYYLDKRRNDIVKEAAIRIQRFSRGFTARRNYQRKRSAAITIQAGLRGWIQRSKYAVLRRGIIQAQAQYRMVLQRRKYLKMLDRPDMIRQDTLYRMREEKRVGDVLQKIENQETERNDVYLKNRANKTAQQKDMPGIHCVSQLEIPRDLANIFRQLPDHYPTHNEEHNIIRLSTVHPQMLNLVMQDDINSFAFSKYVNVYFQSHKWRMKKHVITEPFLKDSDPKEAVAIFKLIMRYMYDVNQTPRQQQLIGNYIVQKGLSNDALCDEIYAQLANQTWLNKDDEARRRGWMLMAACLSCMPPSSRIRKFLLKYVSDHGFRDYKVFCQHKLLQCINMNPDQKRTYPPCLLEWKAIKEIGCMAAQGYFTDGEDKEICHLEPWTTAEEFASYLLRQRGVRDGHHGWTMLLKDDVAIYEYAGYDYVMDLISEMELEPDFPHSWSYYITGLRRQAQTTPVRRDVKRHPHNAEEARILKLSHLGIKELLTPAPAEPRPSPDPQSYFKDKDRDQALSDSKLNRRKQDLDPSLSMDSVLNTRYTKRQAPSVPVNPPRTEQQRAQRPDSPIVLGQLPISAESKLNRRYVTQKKPMPDGLTDSKLNMRYREDLNGSASNGEPISNGELTNGDARPYVKNAHPPSGSSSHLDHTAKDQIIRQKRTTDSYRKSLSESSDFGSVRSNADMDQWVDKLFSPVLTGNLDDLVDARSLEHKMKGGGELNQPAYGASVLYPGGFNNQPTVLNLPNTSLARTQPAAVMYSTNIPMSPPTVPMAAATAAAAVPAAIPTRLTAPVPAVVPALSPAPVPAAVPVPAPTPVPAAVPAPTPAAVTVAVPAPAPTANVPYVGPQVQISVPPAQPAVLSPPVLSVPTDPLQVVMQQGAAQDALQGQQLQTQRIQNRKLQEQTANLQAQLQQQQLQTQILQQSVQTEILKRQLKELQEKDVPKIVSVPLDKTADSSVASPRTISQTAVQPDPDQTPPPLKPAAHGEIDESRPGGVQTLKRAYEQKAPPIRGGLFVPPANSKKGATNKGRGVQFAEDVETIPQAGYSEKQPSTSSPPPPPAAARSPSPPPPPPASPPQPKQTSAHRARSPSPPPPPPPIAVSTASAPPAPPPPASSLPSPPSPPSPPTQTSQAAASASRQSAVNRDTPEALQNVLIESVNEKADGAADRGASEKDQHPPPPPPPPPTTTTTDTTPETTTTAASASDSSKSPESADSGTVKMVRIGKIQWPPPPKEVPQKEVRVGKLFIQESTPTEEPVVPIRKKLNEVVSKAKAEPEAKEVKKTEKENRRKVKSVQLPPSDKEGSIRIDMKERRETLARQLSSINFGQLKESKPKRKPLPAPIAPPPATKETEKIPPPPPKVLTVVTTEPSVGQEEQETPVDVQALEQVHTHLYQQINGPFFMYNKVNWSLEVRKELFTPHEKLDNLDPLLIRLIFAQVVQDVYVGNSVRISKEMRLKLRSLLDSYNVTPHNMLTTDLPVQRRVIEEAKEWPCYFARIFAATGGQRHPNLNYVAVSHSGVYMLKREKDLVEDTLMVLDRFRFENIMSVATPQPYTVQIQMSPYKYTIIYTHKADELRSLINAFCIECEKTEMYVRATKNYQTRESTLLSFQKGDIIKLTNRNMTLDRGWLYGSVHGRAGLFPHDYIEPVPIHEVKKIEQTRGAPKSLSGEDRTKDESIGSVTSTSSLLLEEGTYTMLEFAMMYFRKSPYRYQMARGEGGSIHGTFKEISLQKLHSLEKRKKKHSANGKNWTWKEQVDMIRWTKSPIQISLLELNKEHNKIALECFIAIMRYMGDYPMAKGMGHINCILFVLMQCHSRRVLVDEVFCQLIKQTTNNRSTKSDSETMGWRFLAILTSYFDVSDNLRPYLFKYLESVAHDSSRSTQVLATLCLENARKTVKYGGRKNVPSKNELEAITHGRMTRRQICVLPGGAPVVLNLKSSNVVADLIEKIAANLDIRMPLEREEYILFYVIEEDDIYCPLSTKEYIFDIITELENNKKTFYLLFQRTSWIFPLHLDNHNSLYIDAIYNLCLPDYLDGFLISVPNTTLPQPLKDDIAYIGALLLRIAGKKETPNQKDTSSVIPLNVQSLGDMKLSNWSNQIYHRLFELIDLTPEEAKIRFLEKISEWPLFGSTFFSVKGVSDPRVPGECRLAVNKKGIICLNPKTNETLVSYPLPQIISTRQSTSEKGRHIDIKIGDLMNHKIVQIYAEQVSDIGILINQYITLSKEI